MNHCEGSTAAASLSKHSAVVGLSLSLFCSGNNMCAGSREHTAICTGHGAPCNDDDDGIVGAAHEVCAHRTQLQLICTPSIRGEEGRGGGRGGCLPRTPPAIHTVSNINTRHPNRTSSSSEDWEAALRKLEKEQVGGWEGGREGGFLQCSSAVLGGREALALCLGCTRRSAKKKKSKMSSVCLMHPSGFDQLVRRSAQKHSPSVISRRRRIIACASPLLNAAGEMVVIAGAAVSMISTTCTLRRRSSCLSRASPVPLPCLSRASHGRSISFYR